MQRFILLGGTLLATLTIGYFVGRSSVPTTNRDYSLYIADVTLIDGETGAPVNTTVHYPGGLAPIRREQDAETGRCRIIWIGTSDAAFAFRFSAEGYESVDLPPQAVREVHCSVVVGSGIAGSSTVTMTRSGSESEGRVTASRQSASD